MFAIPAIVIPTKKLSLVTLFLAVLILLVQCVHDFEYTEVGLGYNILRGQVVLYPKHGWNFTPPWVLMNDIDTAPMRVCITSASRAVNCRLVQFDEAHYQDFVRTEGFRFYWWANRLSFNSGYSEEYRGMRDILRGYAFGIKKYPFLQVLDEYSQ